ESKTPANKTPATTQAPANVKAAKAPATKSAASAGASTGGKGIAPIDLPLAEANPDQAWNDYFATHEEVPAERVRETARQLMHRGKFQQLIAMIRAALRNGQVQPWMYEAMGLAMQAGGSSKSEIERALMSAIDLGENTEDFLYVAQYMARCGLESRALKVF